MLRLMKFLAILAFFGILSLSFIMLYSGVNVPNLTPPERPFTVSRRDPFPQSPLLCLAMLSCGRVEYLRAAITAVVGHMEDHEPRVPYELVWVDQTTDPAVRNRIAAEFQFNARLFAASPEGYAWPYNAIYFGVCRAPYVLVVEEDWTIRPGIEQSLFRPSFVEEAITLLQSANGSGLMGVMLRDAGGDSHSTCELATAATPLGEVKYAIHRAKLHGCWLTSYMNGPVLYDRSMLLRLGRFQETTPECEYSARAHSHGMFIAHTHRKARCHWNSSVCNAVLVHVGTKKATKEFGYCHGHVWG